MGCLGLHEWCACIISWQQEFIIEPIQKGLQALRFRWSNLAISDRFPDWAEVNECKSILPGLQD